MQYWKFGHCNISFQKWLVDLARNFLRVVYHRKMHKYMSSQTFIFWLFVMVTAQKLFSLLPSQLQLKVKNSYLPAQNHNAKVNHLNNFQAKPTTLSWDNISQRVISSLVAKDIGISYSNRDFCFILLCYIKICSMLFLIVEFW